MVTLDNISQNQAYYHKQQHQHQQNYGANGERLIAAKEVATHKTNAGFIADKFEPFEHPGIVAKSVLYSVLISIGATRAANWLVKGDLVDKNGKELSHIESLKSSRLYRMGNAIDNTIEKIPGYKHVSDGASRLKAGYKKIKKPKIWAEIVNSVKEGTIAPWDNSKSYQEGKWGEAYVEFYDFLKDAPDQAFKDKKTKDFVEKVMQKVNQGKQEKIFAAKEIIDNGCLDGISAKHLSEVLVNSKSGMFAAAGENIDKLFGTTPNLHVSLAKAKFFNGKMDLRPASKFLNKITMQLLEGTGGGVLGGKMALLMNVVGFVSAFNSVAKSVHVAKQKKLAQTQEATKNTPQVSGTTSFGASSTYAKGNKGGPESAEKITKVVEANKNEKPPRSEKLASFMEDFLGFMVGSYLVLFPLGVAFNKTLGLSNIGRNKKNVQDIADKLGVSAENKVYQETVIEYNKRIKHDRMAQKYTKFLETGKMPLWKRFTKFIGLTTDDSYKQEIIRKMKEKMGFDTLTENVSKDTLKRNLETKMKDKAWFKQTRKDIKQAGKSHLTLKSIFKANDVNTGKFGERLLRYVTQKPLEAAGKIAAKGRFTLLNRGFTPKNILNRFKKIGGGVGRPILVMFVLAVPFRDAFMKLSHKIFGKPSFSQYDEVKGVYDAKEEAAKKAQQAQKTQQAAIPGSSTKPIDLTPHSQPVHIATPAHRVTPEHSNMINMAIQNKKQAPAHNIQAQQKASEEEPKNDIRALDTYTYIPS